MHIGCRMPKVSYQKSSSCPHARPEWRMCPHCLGLNPVVPDEHLQNLRGSHEVTDTDTTNTHTKS